MIVEVVIAEELVHNLERKRAGSGTSKDLAPVQSKSSVVSNDGGKSSSSGPVQMGVLLGPQEYCVCSLNCQLPKDQDWELRGMMKYLQPMRT